MRAFGEGADDDGFATVFGMIPLFDGREEGVHVDVEDDAIDQGCQLSLISGSLTVPGGISGEGMRTRSQVWVC